MSDNGWLFSPEREDADYLEDISFLPRYNYRHMTPTWFRVDISGHKWYNKCAWRRSPNETRLV
jgi:hypothetical protein